MRSLREWMFRFTVTDSGVSGSEEACDLFHPTASDWADRRGLGVGGGVQRVDERWEFDFGLFSFSENCLITELQAQELMDLIRAWCLARGYRIQGGFSEFDAAEE